MARSIVRRLLLAGVASCHLALSLVAAPPGLAQTADREPPVIAYEALEEGRRGDRQVFSATVTDNVGVERVTLRYRVAGSVAYSSLPMTPLAGTDIRTASIDAPSADVTAIEYYIEARDTTGNRSIEGFAFEPLERRLVDAPTSLAGGPVAVEAGGLSTGRKVLYGVLAVVAVGALAAAAGGGSDDGGSGGGGGLNDVPVTIITPQLQP